MLFGDVLARGHMLSQADRLFRVEPWAAYPPAWFTAPGNPLLRDIPELFHPFLIEVRRALGAGEFPLWSPAIFGGQPFFAAFQPALLSPFTALELLVPIPLATVLRALAVLLVGGTGMFLFVRRLGLGWGASIFAGVAYLANPFSVVWLEHPVAPAASWLPWLLWCVEGIVSRARRADTVLLALITACAMVAGHPETSVKAVALAGAYALVRLVTSRAGVRTALLLASGFGVGVLAAAVQVVPFTEYLLASRAYLSRQGLGTNPLFAPPETLVTAVVPNFLGHPVTGTYLPMQNRFGLPSNYCEQQVYAGIATWLLAAVGLVAWRRDARVRFFAGAAVAAASLMYGVPGVVDAVTRVPVIGVAALSRFGLVIISAAIVLAAFGLEAAVGAPCREAARAPAGGPVRAPLWPAVTTALAMAAATMVFLVWARRYLVAHGMLATTVTYSALALSLAAAVVALLWLMDRRRLPVTAGVAVLLVLLGGDLVCFGRGFHPGIPPADVFPVTPEIAAVQRDPGLFRVAGFGDAFIPNASMAYGLQDVRGYDGVWPDRYCRLLDRVFPANLPSHQIPPGVGLALLDLLNVKYIFGPRGLDVAPGRILPVPAAGRSGLYLNTTAFPRAFLADRLLVVSDDAALDIVAHGRVDLRRTAVLTHRIPAAEQPESGTPADSPGEATVVRYGRHEIEVAVRAARRALLVTSDRFDSGWTATVDDREATVHEADYALRTVSVPAGEHRVVFRYQPWTVRVGLVLTLAAWPLLFAILRLAGRGRNGTRAPIASPGR